MADLPRRSSLFKLIGTVVALSHGASAIPTSLDRALRAADVLQERYYHSFSGTWKCPIFSSGVAAASASAAVPLHGSGDGSGSVGGGSGAASGKDEGSWWNCANSLEALANTVAYTENNTHLGVLHHVWAATSLFYLEHKLTAGLDDIQWWALAWIRVAEVARDSQYLKRSIGYFDEVTKYWDDSTCKGGVWWDRKRTYKNAITNELFIMLAIRLYGATKDDHYLQWAKRSWLWFRDSSLIDSDGLINDGLNGTCQNNGGETWTYNQGVILGALAELYLADNSTVASDPTTSSGARYLDEGVKIADAVMHQKLAAGLLHESCEPDCNNDGKQFKGIFIRYLAYFTKVLPPRYEDYRAKYQEFIAQNAETLWRKDRDSLGAFGVSWGGPAVSADAISHTSGLDATNAELWLQVSPVARSGRPVLYAKVLLTI